MPMLNRIEHPIQYRDGTRVLMLKSRHKDGHATEREIFRVTHSAEHLERTLTELMTISIEGERIYVSACSRDMTKAVRLFKQRQIDADYSDDPLGFYRGINERWVSALMAPTSRATKVWLFDCDSEKDEELVRIELSRHYDSPVPPYRYNTKSGVHIIVQPFDRSKLTDTVRSMLQDNPLMLFAY